MFLFALFVLPAVLLVSFVLYLPYLIKLWVEKRRLPFARHAPLFLLVCTVVMVLYATIFWYGFTLDFSPGYHLLNLIPLVWAFTPYEMGVPRMLEQLALNLVMFVPLGLLLPAAFPSLRRFWRTAVVCLAATLAIETLQYFTGRSADIDDVLLNLLGGMLGYGLFALLRARLSGRSWFCAALDLHAEPDPPQADPLTGQMPEAL